MTCVFAEGSLADGCLVIFINEHNESWEHVINKTSGENNVTKYITIPNGIVVCVMDISLSGGRLWAYTAREIIFEGVARDYYLKGGIRP